MRDIHEVIKCILDAIPPEESPLRDAIKRVARDAMYTAPEIRANDWQRLADALNHTPLMFQYAERPEWAERVRRILEGEQS